MSGVPSTTDSLASALSRTALAPVQVVAFWSAIALPLAYLPLLAGGLETGELSLFVGLLAVHAAALVIGRDHAQE
ncbi:hypothetical protein ACFQJC_08415 [Haloferax namakaokahaiae]|uniref:Uncharacterized protein n=1 Tax=Haloferax namakaokahaiae TaxID=1748331 RepID=A0ABD5ZEH8_9EURY